MCKFNWVKFSLMTFQLQYAIHYNLQIASLIYKIKHICINCAEFKNSAIFVPKCSSFTLILWKYFTILGNLHLNLTSPEYSTEVMDKIEPFLYDWVANHKGSISAEHGLGFKKKNFIYHSKSKSAVRLMKDIKHTFDPNMILNPYKVLPDFWWIYTT